MAARDKMHEFYTCLHRFGFLASAYRPEDVTNELSVALDVIAHYAQNDSEILRRIEQSRKYFEQMDERLRNHQKKDLIDFLLSRMD